MTATRFDASPSNDAFTAALHALGADLPVRLHETEVGLVVDAAGREFCTVDVNRERPDEEAAALANWIACAVNTCGGFAAVPDRSA